MFRVFVRFLGTDSCCKDKISSVGLESLVDMRLQSFVGDILGEVLVASSESVRGDLNDTRFVDKAEVKFRELVSPSALSFGESLLLLKVDEVAVVSMNFKGNTGT